MPDNPSQLERLLAIRQTGDWQSGLRCLSECKRVWQEYEGLGLHRAHRQGWDHPLDCGTARRRKRCQYPYAKWHAAGMDEAS